MWMADVRTGCDSQDVERTHRCGRFIMLVKSRAKANPEHDKNGYEDNQEKREAASFQSYSPQSRHECVNGENLVRHGINCS